jgi:hypothetical protein
MDSCKILKIFPLGIVALLTYKIYQCPCGTLLGCQKGPSLALIGILGAMILFGFPNKIASIY